MKRCQRCQQTKSSTAFSLDRSNKDGLQDWCKDCYREHRRGRPRRTKQTYRPEVHKAYYQKNRERIRWHNTLKKYGVTAAEYDKLLAYQHGVCAICLNPPAAGKTLGVDHDHRTGRVRGLLCDQCNFAIGLLGDHVGRILVAASYVLHHGAITDRIEMAAWVMAARPQVGRHAPETAMPTLWDVGDDSP